MKTWLVATPLLMLFAIVLLLRRPCRRRRASTCRRASSSRRWPGRRWSAIPLFACFDDRGRLFVAEGTGTNLPGDGAGRRRSSAASCCSKTPTATAGSTRARSSPTSWSSRRASSGTTAPSTPPRIRASGSFEDTDGDGKADRREELVTGFKFNGNGCDIHGPFLGPDGRLYWTDGRHGYKVKTRDGEALEGLASRIWRCRPDGTDIERLCGGGFDNPVELAFTADGEMIGTMDQGPGDCLLHYVEGGVYPMDHPCVKEFPWTGPMLGARADSTRRRCPRRCAALMRYRSDAFGAEYRDAFFTTQFMTHKLVRSTR